MRSIHVCSVLAALGAMLTASGCWDAYNEIYVPLTELDGSGGSGGTTTVTPACIPSGASDPIDDECGVFVSSSIGKDDTEKDRGSKDKPFATIAQALGASKGKPLYLCGETFTEAVEIKAGALIYGALDCTADWKYASAKRTVIAPAADAVALRVTSKSSAELYDVNLLAAGAVAPGGSSIAMLAESDTDVMLARSDIEAGDGAAGAAGEAPSGAGAPGEKGMDGGGGCDSDAGELGGSGGQLTCDETNVAGGDGGPGTKNATGGPAGAGLPSGGGGTAGLAQGVNVNCATDGKGGDGTPGTKGDPGAGAPMSLGTLSAGGYAGIAGNAGKSGQPGQGGGGGGGGRVCGNGKAGPSGGGGGSGACGGAGGQGGQAGGASIGIASLGATLTLDSVNISTKAGGKGGAGAAGQTGGTGGAVGLPGGAEVAGNSATACPGGQGGDGGTGGQGGGGRGGHSIGIAHTGTAPDVTGTTITTGPAGEGGTGDGDMGSGAAGVKLNVQKF